MAEGEGNKQKSEGESNKDSNSEKSNEKEIPKRYDPKLSEPKWQKFWEDNTTFKFDEKDGEREVYSIDTPPPYASADHLHVGHAMHYSQFEFVARFKRMRGFNVLFPMGFDDNGLPTERFVEKKHKVDKSTISRSDFIKLCLDETEKVGQKYKQMWTGVGLSVDWSLLYSTISPYCQKIAQRSFIDLFKKDRLKRIDEPVMWCVKCQTAIAQADLEDLQKHSKFSDVKFKFAEDDSDIVISTTRPELIPACVALFVHPDDNRYKNYVGKKAKIPLFNYEVPILEDESVAMDVGTGFMMVCTWGDVEDVEKWKKYKLDTRLVINEEGKMNELAGKYKGMTLNDARKAILDDLDAEGLVPEQKDIQHVTNVHERCNTPIEFFKTPQWFIRLLDKKKELVKQVEKINWYPAHMKIRGIHWIENLKWDWCISRQRFFGIPFPVWYCKKCSEVILPDDSDLPVNPTEQKSNKKCKCGSEESIPEEDVMDTWMTSSMTPQIALRWGEKNSLMEKHYPMSLRPQGHDIIRTWAFYTIVKSYFHENNIPWKDIMISGHGQDPKGKKMSKRIGNVVTVNEAIDKYSADALRFWAASVTLGEDLPFMEKDLLTGQKTITKLWNATKFALMHLKDYQLGKPDKIEAFDRWIIARFNQVLKIGTDNFDKYEYSKCKNEVENLFWNVFCDYYLEICKDRLYNPDKRGEDSRLSAQFALYNVLLGIIKMFSPIMPHITEELYHLYFNEKEGIKSIHNSKWPEDIIETDNADHFNGNVAADIIAAVRKYKSENKLAMNAPLKKLFVHSEDEKIDLKKIVEDFKEDLSAVLKAEEIELNKDKVSIPCSKFAVEIGIES
ncbi:valine--tRNA ligase [Nanoarchaeota archaeon]